MFSLQCCYYWKSNINVFFNYYCFHLCFFVLFKISPWHCNLFIFGFNLCKWFCECKNTWSFIIKVMMKQWRMWLEIFVKQIVVWSHNKHIFFAYVSIVLQFWFDDEPKNTKRRISSLKRTNPPKMQYLYIGSRWKLHQPHKFVLN